MTVQCKVPPLIWHSMSLIFIVATVFQSFAFNHTHPRIIVPAALPSQLLPPQKWYLLFSVVVLVQLTILLGSCRNRMMMEANSKKKKIDRSSFRFDPCTLSVKLFVFIQQRSKNNNGKIEENATKCYFISCDSASYCVYILLFSRISHPLARQLKRFHTNTHTLFLFSLFLRLLPSSKFTDNTAFDELFLLNNDDFGLIVFF